MSSHGPFGHLKQKLWPKKRLGVKLPIWLLTIKSWESTQFPCVQVACRWRATYCWKTLNQGYNFALDHIAIGGLHAKLWAPKVTKVLVARILRLPLGSFGTKCHLDVGLLERHIIHYKGEGGGFPQVGVVLNLVNLKLFVVHPSTKMTQIM
jgi:hypothetical protein